MNALSLIIPAAGSGVRLGSEIPKPFIRIGDKTILEHTVRRFLDYKGLKQVVIATSAAYLEEVQVMLDGIGAASIMMKAVEGGAERQYSIYNALGEVDERSELIAVHDAVRPFISATIIEQCCRIADEYGGAVVGVPAKDTIKKVDEDNVIIETPDRSMLWQAQTPQVFKKELLIRAYESAMNHDLLGTDDASLVEAVGGVVKMVEGERENLKITYPIDLQVAELILKNKS
ncbi:2-C-methyl-D-erythritol 4-phosphate cytidylyltransferase [Balneola sp. MJW-20]|uniref:2-C-methyl-D-erythritol 4-phosphate cytidylyltransferase n=1 Tax=Gracilimonas aurantiaca TaxID=3234185 RepID=UPI0034673974